MADRIGRAPGPDLRLEQEQPVPRQTELDVGMHHIDAPLPLMPVSDLLSDPIKLGSHLGALKGEDLRSELSRINQASETDPEALSKLTFGHVEKLHEVFQKIYNEQGSSKFNPMLYARLLVRGESLDSSLASILDHIGIAQSPKRAGNALYQVVAHKVDQMLAILESQPLENSNLETKLKQIKTDLEADLVNAQMAVERINKLLDPVTTFERSLEIYDVNIPKKTEKMNLNRLNRAEKIMGTEYYPFYHATERASAIGYKLLSVFMSALSAEDRTYLRDLMSDTIINTDTFLQGRVVHDSNRSNSAAMLSATYHLFTNQPLNETAMFFLGMARNCNVYAKEIFMNIFKTLTHAKIVSLVRVNEYLEKILEFDKVGQVGNDSLGALLQIFIREEHVNKIAYLSRPYGAPFEGADLKKTVDAFRNQKKEDNNSKAHDQVRILLTEAFYADSDAVDIKTYFEPKYEKSLKKFFNDTIIPMIIEDIAKFEPKTIGNNASLERVNRLEKVIKNYQASAEKAHERIGEESVLVKGSYELAPQKTIGEPMNLEARKTAARHAITMAELKEQRRARSYQKLLDCIAT